MTSPTAPPRPRAVLLGVQLPGVDEREFASSLDELERLAQDARPRGRRAASRSAARGSTPGAVVGEGKLKELAEWTGGTGVVPTGPPQRGARQGRCEAEATRRPSRRGRGRRRERSRERPEPRARGASCSSITTDADAGAQPRARDRRGGARSHRGDPRDLPAPRAQPRGAAAGRDRAAHLHGAAPARDRRRARPRGRRHRRARRGRERRSSSSAARSATAIAELRDELARRSSASRARGASGAASRTPSRSSATRTPASRR